MNLPVSVIALLPETVLIVTGVLVMLIEAVLKPAASRKPLGWLAIAGTTIAGFISVYQLRLGTLTAFSGSIQVDAFSSMLFMPWMMSRNLPWKRVSSAVVSSLPSVAAAANVEPSAIRPLMDSMHWLRLFLISLKSPR